MTLDRVGQLWTCRGEYHLVVRETSGEDFTWDVLSFELSSIIYVNEGYFAKAEAERSDKSPWVRVA